MTHHKYFRPFMPLACAGCLLALGVAGVSFQNLMAQEEETEGSVIQIAPDVSPDDPLSKGREGVLGGPRPGLGLFPGNPSDLARQRQPLSPYYIGVAATKVEPQVRAHVDLPADVGLMVREAFESSPAAEAGIEQYDILIAADGKELKELDDLIRVVKDHSKDDNLTQFTVDLLRKGQRETLWVTPAKRPEMPRPNLPGFGEGFRPRDRQLLQQLLERQGGGINFGGDLPLGMPQGFGLNQIEGNVSVSVTRENDGPAMITVSRDGETWEVVGDDPESLDQLPEDLRPMVENMLRGGNQMQIPFGGFNLDDNDGIRDRMEEVEQQLRQLQNALGDAPDNDLDNEK